MSWALDKSIDDLERAKCIMANLESMLDVEQNLSADEKTELRELLGDIQHFTRAMLRSTQLREEF